MNKTFKPIAYTLLALAAILAIAATSLVIFVNPNHFKPAISQAVHKMTGRTLTIKGNIGWSFFPFVGLTVNNATLSNAPGFGEKLFAKIGEADVRIKLLPLLKKRIEARKVILKETTVNLITDASGKNNWDDFLQKKSTEPNTSTKSDKQTTTPKPSKTRLLAFTSSVIQIENANLNLDNQATGQEISINDINISSNNAGLGKTFPVKIAFLYQQSKPKVDATFSLETEVNINPTEKTIRLKDLLISINDAKIKANLIGKNITTTPIFTGKITVTPFDLKSLLRKFGMLITTKNPSALQYISAEANISASEKFLKLTNLQAKLDKTSIDGYINLNSFNKVSADFKLNLSTLDFSDYMATTKKLTTKPQASQKRAKKSVTVKKGNALLAPAHIVLNGQITAKQLTFGKLNVHNIKANITTNNDNIKLSPLTAQLYQGSTHDTVTVNMRSREPHYSGNINLQNIELGQLMQDMAGNQRITGRANLQTNFSTRGLSTEQLKRHLNGKGKINIKNGVIQGVNINYQIEAVKAFINKKNPPIRSTGPRQTPFGNLAATFTIKNGVIHNNDLTLNGPSLRVTGKGHANIVNEQLNYDLNVDTINDKNLPMIPVKITGTFSSPKATPNVAAIAASIAKQQLGRIIEDKLGGKSINKKIDLKKLLPF